MRSEVVGLRVPETYMATAQVMIEPRESHILDVFDEPPPIKDSATIETQIKLIHSRATLARMIERLNELASERAGIA